MKRNKLQKGTQMAAVILLAATTIFTVSCGGRGGSGGRYVDIPAYATGEGAYFAGRETETAHAVCGKGGINYGHKKFGNYDGSMISGTLIEMEGSEDGVQFVVLQSGNGPSLTSYMFRESHIYSVQLLWHEFEGEENPINAAMAADLRGRGYTPLENNYCTSYYFYRDEALADAASWLSTLEKQPNQKSKYDAKVEGGVKTYHAAIGRAVEYFGENELKADRFLSLYLDCGAVVEFRAKGARLEDDQMAGKTIDCVTDANNRVIIYELN
jgi:hypothetical protein